MKKPAHKDEADEPKSGRLSTRLSIFSRQQDAGSAGSSRSTAKGAITRGAMVQTFLGPAIVRHVRTEDGMCEVGFLGKIMIPTARGMYRIHHRLR